MKKILLIFLTPLLFLLSCDIAKEDDSPAFVGTWTFSGTGDRWDENYENIIGTYTFNNVWKISETTQEFASITSDGKSDLFTRGTVTILDDKTIKMEDEYDVDPLTGANLPLSDPWSLVYEWSVTGNILSLTYLEEADGKYYTETYTRQ